MCFKCKVLILKVVFYDLFNCWTQIRRSASEMGLLAMIIFMLDNDLKT